MTEIEEIIDEIERELRLKPGLFSDLKKDDDWSFLIKSHALMESVCSYLLTSYFDDARFKDIFSRIEMSDSRIGKIAFLKAAGLITKEEARFIIGLSELRNKMVHNIEGVHFNFSDYVNKLDEPRRKTFAETFGYAHMVDSHGKLTLKDHKIVLTNPKSAIWWGIALILAIIKMEVKIHGSEKEIMKYKLENLDLLQSRIKNTSGWGLADF